MAENLLGFQKQYVFYKRIQDDADNDHPKIQQLEKGLQSAKEHYIGKYNDRTNLQFGIIPRLETMIKNEREKERNILSARFNSQAVMNAYAKGDMKEIITGVNDILSFRGQLERNIKRIMANNTTKYKEGGIGDIAISANIGGYIQPQFTQKRHNKSGFDQIVEDYIYGKINQADFDDRMEKFFDDIIRSALDKMLESETIKGLKDDPYKEVRELLANNESKASPILQEYINSIKREFNFNELFELDKIKKLKIPTEIKRGVISSKGKQKTVRGGGEEIFNTLLGNISTTLKRQIPDLKMEQVGHYQAKADMIIAEIQINLQTLEKEFVGKLAQISKKGMDNRDDRLKEMADLKNETGYDIDKDFIIFVNAKSYIEKNKKGHRFSGFDTGVMTSNLRSFEEIAARFGLDKKRYEEKMGAILQTIQGGYFQDKQDEFLQTLAEDFAFFLFDDWNLIGQPNNQALHIYDLDGIYIPLSVLLEHMKQAIEGTLKDRDFKDVFNISIHGKIEDKHQGKSIIEAQKEGGYTKADWIAQRDSGLNNTYLTAKFMGDFFTFIRETF